MTVYEYVMPANEILTNIKRHCHAGGYLAEIDTYELMLRYISEYGSVKAALLTLEQQHYGSYSTLKRIKLFFEQDITVDE